MYHIFYIHYSVEGHLGSFQLLDIINKAAMNIVEHVTLLQVGASSGYMPRSNIAGSSGSTMSNFLRNYQTDFQSGWLYQLAIPPAIEECSSFSTYIESVLPLSVIHSMSTEHLETQIPTYSADKEQAAQMLVMRMRSTIHLAPLMIQAIPGPWQLSSH